MANRNQESTASVIDEKMTMDTRKFLSAINNSAQSQVAFFEDAVRRLGGRYGREWELTALQSNRMIIEDVESHDFMVAEHAREKGGRVKITNVKMIELHEDKKPELFEQSCLALVEAIETGDAKAVDAAFNKIAASRFRSTAVPTSGIVKTKDGIIRHIAVSEDSNGRTLADRIIECLSDKVTLNESGQIEASFIDDDFRDLKLGVTELTTRKLVARHMQEAAKGAYQSSNFQTLVETIAGLICKDNLEQAVEYAGKFLREHQEFCLLDAHNWNTLVANTLATKACFNEDLIGDVATLMRKTNLKANRIDLIEAWRKTAERANHPVMLENVDTLSEAKDFEEAYDQFLGVILEATGEVTKGALISGLEMLKQKVESGDVDDPTKEELDAMIQDLRQTGDSQAVWKAMETLDSVRRHIDKMQGMDDFDEMPGPLEDEPAGDLDADAGLGEAGSLDAATVSGGGDKPLKVSIEMDPVAMAQGAQASAPAPALEPSAEEEGSKFDLSSLDDIDLEGEDIGDEEEEEKLNLAASKEKDDEPISESAESDDAVADFLKSEGIDGGVIDITQDSVDESVEVEEVETEEVEEVVEESDDPYSLPADIELEDVQIDKSYQTFMEEISDSDAVAFGDSLENPEEEDPDALQAHAEAWVRDKMKAKIGGVQDPKQQQQDVTDLAGQLLAKRLEARKQGMGEGKDSDDGISENQYKSPLVQLSKRGLKKAAVSKLVKEGKFQWLDKMDNAVLGQFKDVKFVLDHTEKPTAVLSENGEVQVPVPDELVAGALFLSAMSDQEAEADAFVEWLDQHIESLRITEDSIDETAKIMEEQADGPDAMERVEELTAEPDGEEVVEESEASEEAEGSEAVSESLPPALEKHKFKAKGEAEENDEDDSEDEAEENDEE